MRGDEHRNARFLPQQIEIAPEVEPGAGIETGARFIEQEHPGIVQQPLGNLDPAGQTSGERFDQVSALLAESETVEESLRTRFHDFRLPPEIRPISDHLIQNGEVGIQCILLRADTERLPRLARLAKHVIAHEPDLSSRCRIKTGYAVHRGGFSGAVRSKKPEALSFLNFE